MPIISLGFFSFKGYILHLNLETTYMGISVLKSLFLVTALFFGSPEKATPQSTSSSTEKVILIDLSVNSPQQAARCYTSAYDKKKVALEVEIDDTLYFLQDFILEEEQLEGPECFFPEMKLVFERYTYVVSMYCTQVHKYRNSAPYRTSSQKVRSDLKMTETVLEYLQHLHKKYFGNTINLTVARKFVKNPPIEEEKVDTSVLDNEEDEDENEDKELEKEAIDKDGWFDERQKEHADDKDLLEDENSIDDES